MPGGWGDMAFRDGGYKGLGWGKVQKGWLKKKIKKREESELGFYQQVGVTVLPQKVEF